MVPMDSWQTKRTFGWGIVLFLDRDSGDVPELSDSPVSQSPHGFVVKVHHAEDVDLDGFAGDKGVPPAEVQILIWLDREAPGPGTFSGVIEVPSGVLTVGDADHEDALAIGAGRWSVQIDCEPSIHSDRVAVWLRRA
jgi:hypothetical protein